MNRLDTVGENVFAYVQPKGEWGLSNAGLIVDGEKSLLVDTLFDLKLTEEMLTKMRDATPAAKNIDILVNTHDNGDHCFGNQLVDEAEIIASKACALYMDETRPKFFHQLMEETKNMGELGVYYQECFGRYDFSQVELRKPTKTFDRKLDVTLENKTVELVNLGPAHTDGDSIVIDHEAKVLFTGDIIFNDITPIMWSGPVSNWIKACDYIEQSDVEVVVPGHGEITDRSVAPKMKSYLEYVSKEARKRFDEGLEVVEAALDIALNDYSSWGDSERIAANVLALYREYDPSRPVLDRLSIFELMCQVKRATNRK